MRKLGFLWVFVLVWGCVKQPSADLVILNATIYTVDDSLTIVNALAIKDQKILKVGAVDEIKALVSDNTQILDLTGKFIFPGFIEGHAHLIDIGDMTTQVDLSGAQTYDEVVDLVAARASITPTGEWIIGSGWHQDKWVNTLQEKKIGGFPTHHKLTEISPDHPVALWHASGHAALVNAKAMELLDISSTSKNPSGGEILKDISGQPTGIFNEAASLIVWDSMPKDNQDVIRTKLKAAIAECLKNGITGFHDARSEGRMIEVLESLAENGELKLRMHLMLDGLDSLLIKKYFEIGSQQGLYNDHLNIRSVKLYADGALGSRGAWLLEEYSDAHGVHGHNFTPLDQVNEIVAEAVEHGFQVCTHAIGDRANREVLDIYETALKEYPQKAKDHRFRIEHAQHIHPDDIPRFAELGVIPAMQAIHMSSDRPWAIDRLGKERIVSGAYMWKELIDNGSFIVNGTDAPVEPVNALASFYASVSRKTLKGTPEGGYEPKQKMSRVEALKSYTIWAAFGAFMEETTGSIEVGKWADLTILDNDIMTISEGEILKTKVVMTIVDGEVVYSQD